MPLKEILKRTTSSVASRQHSFSWDRQSPDWLFFSVNAKPEIGVPRV